MSWTYKGIKVDITHNANFVFEVEQDGEAVEQTTSSLKEAQAAIDLHLKRKGRPNLDLPCLIYEVDRYDPKAGEVKSVSLLGVSGTDGSFRLRPKLTGRVYPDHSHVNALLTRLAKIEVERDTLHVALGKLKLGTKGRKGYGRSDPLELERMNKDLREEYDATMDELNKSSLK